MHFDTNPKFGDTKMGFGDTKPLLADTKQAHSDTESRMIDTTKMAIKAPMAKRSIFRHFRQNFAKSQTHTPIDIHTLL